MWKSNKEGLDNRYGAYVIHWTDYSPGRKQPLKKDVRLAASKKKADEIAAEILSSNIKKGWQAA